jgi:hypothetical protein
MVQSNVVSSNLLDEVDVKFRTLAQSSVEPPQLRIPQVHAAFSMVLNFCGAIQCFESVERYAKRNGSVHENGETDVALLPLSKLMLTADRQG